MAEFLLWLFFAIKSHVFWAGLKLITWLTMTLNFWSPPPSNLWSAGITARATSPGLHGDVDWTQGFTHDDQASRQRCSARRPLSELQSQHLLGWPGAIQPYLENTNILHASWNSCSPFSNHSKSHRVYLLYTSSLRASTELQTFVLRNRVLIPTVTTESPLLS